MDLVRATNSVALPSRDIAPATGTPQYFTNGVPGTVAATTLPGYFLNMLIDELCAIVTAGGGTLDDVASAGSWNQVWQYLFRSHTFIDSGLVNTITISLPSGLSFPAAAVGLGTTVRVKIAHANTAAATITLFGLPAAPILIGGNALSGGELQAADIAEFVADGAGNYEVLASSGNVRQAIVAYTHYITSGSGNWTAPYTGVIEVEGWGGGGGSHSPGANLPSWGGGSGGYFRVRMPVAANQVFAYAIGAGGATGAPASGGGTTSWNGGAQQATGGGAGSQVTAGSGGAASGGDLNLTGGSGINLGGSIEGGYGGSAPRGGSGGNQGNSQSSGGAASPGTMPGGGAGGANGVSGAFGAAGASGAIYIEYVG